MVINLRLVESGGPGDYRLHARADSDVFVVWMTPSGTQAFERVAHVADLDTLEAASTSPSVAGRFLVREILGRFTAWESAVAFRDDLKTRVEALAHEASGSKPWGGQRDMEISS